MVTEVITSSQTTSHVKSEQKSNSLETCFASIITAADLWNIRFLFQTDVDAHPRQFYHEFITLFFIFTQFQR
jgi:hypothetical protein